MIAKLYRHELSGHSHRIELFLSLIGKDVELIDVDLARGEHRNEEFLKLNSFGQVPVLVDGEVTLSDSTAILVYLAGRYAKEWLPLDPMGHAQVQRWLSVASGEVVAGPGAARLVKVFNAPIDHNQAKSKAHGLLNILESHLNHSLFLAAERPTIADIALYTYIAHAPEGDVSLHSYPSVRAWLERIERLPGFVGMKRTVTV